jgi:hypothetical protein
MLNSVERYSSIVTISLRVSGLEFEVAQLTDQHVYLRQPIDVEPGDGEVVITVDGDAMYKSVFLPLGVSKETKRGLYL